MQWIDTNLRQWMRMTQIVLCDCRKIDIRLNCIFRASWKNSTRVENTNDALSRKAISEELIDMSGFTYPVVSENAVFICASDAKNIPQVN